jgi:hypothetical protein
MDEYQLEKAFEILGQLRRLDIHSEKISSLIELVEQKLDLCRIVFKDDDNPAEECEVRIAESEITWSIWRAATWAVQQLISQAEEETRSRPGCLPLDPSDCELMGLAFNLRDATMEGYWLCETKLKRRREKNDPFLHYFVHRGSRCSALSPRRDRILLVLRILIS